MLLSYIDVFFASQPLDLALSFCQKTSLQLVWTFLYIVRYIFDYIFNQQINNIKAAVCGSSVCRGLGLVWLDQSPCWTNEGRLADSRSARTPSEHLPKYPWRSSDELATHPGMYPAIAYMKLELQHPPPDPHEGTRRQWKKQWKLNITSLWSIGWHNNCMLVHLIKKKKKEKKNSQHDCHTEEIKQPLHTIWHNRGMVVHQDKAQLYVQVKAKRQSFSVYLCSQLKWRTSLIAFSVFLPWNRGSHISASLCSHVVTFHTLLPPFTPLFLTRLSSYKAQILYISTAVRRMRLPEAFQPFWKGFWLLTKC